MTWAAWLTSTVAVGAAGWFINRDRRTGLAAAAVFGSMPLVVLNAAALPVLLILALMFWLSGIAAFERTGRARWLAMSVTVLASAAAIDGSALVTMPPLVICTLLLLTMIGPTVPARALVITVAACAVAALPLAIYLLLHPEWIVTRVIAHGLYDAQRFNMLQGTREMTSWVGLTARSETYWHYLDPAFLFLSGRVFLLPAALLLPLGIARVATDRPRRVKLLVLAGLLAAPLAGALLVQGPAPSRFVAAAPFAALLAFVDGLAGLLEDQRLSRVRAGQVLGLLLILSAMVFALGASRLS